MFQRLKNLTAASFALLLAVNVQAIDLPIGVYAISCSENDTAMISHSGPASPSTIYSLSLKDISTEAILFPQMAGIDAKNLVAPKAITFRQGMASRSMVCSTYQ